MNVEDRRSVSAAPDDRLDAVIAQAIADAGGWIGFDRYMALALYTPGLGYYAHASRKFGLMPASGSDFVTAPELSPLFGRALARQVAQALEACGADEVWEFGAGSGALADHLLEALDVLGVSLRRYTIVDLSGALRERQRQRLARHGARVQWADAWPSSLHGVALGNEVLDAMPVQLVHWDGRNWHERGVARRDGRFVWADRATDLRPPVPADWPFVPGTTTELHLQAHAFIGSLAERMQRAVAFFVDYGFPQAEYYHPQRLDGTLMCHRAHRAESGDRAALDDPGLKDVTSHVDFTGIALAGQDAGLEVLGYGTQARFLMNCGLLELLATASAADRANAQKLMTEHEMGELFKVIALARGCAFDPIGFAQGDRTHTL